MKTVKFFIALSAAFTAAFAQGISAQKSDTPKESVEFSSEEASYQKFKEGGVYLHSFRGDVKFTLHGKEISANAGDLLPSENFAFEASEGARVSIALSNRISFYVEGPAKMSVAEFKQVHPFRSFLTDERESTRSKLRLRIESGNFYFAKLTSRPTSHFEIETKMGVFEPRGKSFIVICREGENRLTFIEGQGSVRPNGGDEKFAQAGQTAFLRAASGKSSVELELRQTPVTLEQHYSEELKVSRFVLSSIEFFFDAEKNMSARKLILPDFFLGDAAYTR